MSSVLKLKSKPKNFKTELDKEQFINAEKEIETQLIQKQEMQLRYEKAFGEGYENAKKELQNEFENQLIKKSEEFYKILSSFEGKLADYDSSLPEIISSVSLMVAEKIVSSHLENKSIINETIKKAVQKILGANEIIIKINTGDYELLNSSNNISFIDNTNTKVKFEISDKISPGGCLIESEIGNVDARIASQFEEMMRTFRNNFENINPQNGN
jgi:flagellar assembly protein FliH